MTDKLHHFYGGSSAKQWANCYGWASLVVDAPSEPAGEPALRGNALHEGCLEIKAQREIDFLTSGTPVILDYSTIENWPEEGAVIAEEFWEVLWKNVLEEFITGKTIYIEKKLMLFEDMDAGGTADFVCLYYNDKGKLVAVLGDCKFGEIRVEPSDEQLKFYLAALNKAVREKGKQIEVFKSFVYQPSHEEAYTEHTFTKSEIEKAEAKYERAILESKKDKPKFKVGDWCKYCKGQARCVTYAKHLDKEMELMVVRQKDTVKLADPELMDEETLAKIYLFSDKIKKYLSKVSKEIVLRFINNKEGDLSKYLKVVEGRSSRRWADEGQTVDVLKSHGVNPYKSPVLRGLGEVKTDLTAHGKKPKEADAIINALCVKPEGKPKITTIDDPKPDFQFTNTESLLAEFEDDGDF